MSRLLFESRAAVLACEAQQALIEKEIELEKLKQQRKPLTDEQMTVLQQCRNEAMKWTIQARIPECGAFGGIAQDLDWLCNQLTIEAKLKEKNT